ncbi:PTS sugar transporter subunit IIB [Aerococcaceae bacterium zg-ZJ1578]|uniref:PTS sugar transporter subunit IIB n=1 Tax=Aerococcaceae TaxID=186827 RepID=UPI0013BA3FB2|nr:MULTISPECIES: PTS sugar transporter subunit IIB [unclassified Facklamia]MBK0348304.1 PTS sugar transporter subunit IIB [Aerococcaceae bacterium zg-1578]MBR7927579.1 PTS sugar transporter subunit IIB [Aerococcaceae bacterium zg-ZUI334]MBS4462130.1 PTS sugar transporter subunit IIB [Aerococcaceae bacterium zg-B36]QQD65403.1 PTS sugar transporter subunit IIB [Aerococcaceae bacterium zg-252]NEW64590.1 PTS sugar transporter subunit IIB [Facklamia sp. 252]
MVNITLICAAGMSTSMLMQKMKEAAKQKGVEVEITAMAESSYATYTGHTDILLIGPQMSFIEEKIRKQYEPQGIKVEVINMMDYGMMNGAKVLEDALKLIG